MPGDAEVAHADMPHFAFGFQAGSVAHASARRGGLAMIVSSSVK